MTTMLPLGHYLLAPPALLPARHFDDDPAHEITHEFLAEAFATTARYRTDLSRQQGLFEDFYRQTETGVEATAEIEALADAVHEAEERSRAGVEADLRKVAESVEFYRRRNRSRHDRKLGSMVRLGEEIIDVCGAWLELYQNLEIRLRKLASDRNPEPASRVFLDGTEAIQHLHSIATT
jgi:hypothetical protein